jgi:hypothetical protein
MIPQIVKQAMRAPITNIGQLSKADLATLETYVRKGWLSKGQGGHYPAIKTVYACPGYPFEEMREAAIKDMLAQSQRMGERVTVKFEKLNGVMTNDQTSVH